MASKKKQVSVALTPALVKRLDRFAKAQGRSRSAVIEEMCQDGLAEGEVMIKAMNTPVLRDAFVAAFGTKEVQRQLLRTMGEEVSDEQLDLFGKAMKALTESTER